MKSQKDGKLWFDVENERYTTKQINVARSGRLWFDVENERYTTMKGEAADITTLWFDVENERYTTCYSCKCLSTSCGLMQKTKDIQQSFNIEEKL